MQLEEIFSEDQVLDEEIRSLEHRLTEVRELTEG